MPFAFEIDAPLGERDRLVAELHSCDTLGLLEREQGFVAYFADAAVAPALHALASPERGIRVRGPEPVVAEDWERGWRAGLAPRRVGGLWIRPSWCASQGQPEIEIDPKQAFGSGEHASTRLALGMLLDALRPGDRLLDVGSGSGILGLAALRLGGRSALGLDFDADACRNARENAERNALPLVLCRSTTDALRAGTRFTLVVANMLAAELSSCLEALAQLCERELILSGYLDRERGLWAERLASAGLQLAEEREEAHGEDRWWSSRWVATRDRQSARTDSRVVSNE
jgi:ribosomal protein L11 methyltransferase